jgi:predicted lipoprotein with Yx(FWY)xxD motif
VHGHLRPLTVGALLCLALVACGGDEIASDDLGTDEPDEAAEGEDTGTADEDAPTADEDAGDDAPGEAGDVTVASASVDLGEILVDADGLSLYLFEPDEQGPSTCDDDCEASWPPLVTDGEPTADDGADPDLLSTTERDDGTSQVTYDGWPLYRWAGDEAEGDINGQGIQGVWWLVDPTGAPVRDDARVTDEEEPAPTDDGARSGY